MKDSPAVIPGRAPPLRFAQPVGHRTECGKLVRQQLPLFVAADEDLEHHPAIQVEEQDRR
jgi:hypothetical protein